MFAIPVLLPVDERQTEEPHTHLQLNSWLVWGMLWKHKGPVCQTRTHIRDLSSDHHEHAVPQLCPQLRALTHACTHYLRTK